MKQRLPYDIDRGGNQICIKTVGKPGPREWSGQSKWACRYKICTLYILISAVSHLQLHKNSQPDDGE